MTCKCGQEARIVTDTEPNGQRTRFCGVCGGSPAAAVETMKARYVVKIGDRTAGGGFYATKTEAMRYLKKLREKGVEATVVRLE